MTSVPATPPAPARSELFSPERRTTTLGIVMLISIIAFESMGVGTAMPALVADLGAVSLYAWPFVTFMAASVFGTVVGGRWCDRAGPRLPLVAAPVLFAVGLAVAGTATALPQLLLGRVLQGLGAGALAVAIYVLIAVVYPESARPAVFALTSSAWVLPTLIGPPVSGVVTEAFSWHWVFLGLLPLVVVAVILVLPAVRRLERPAAPHAPGPRGVVLAAFAAAVGVSALSWAGQEADAVGAVVAVVALALVVPALRRLFPPGVFRARRGVAAVVLSRGLLAGTFFTITSYLPLMLHGTHEWSLAAAGIPLIAGSLGWSAASAWQGRHPDLSRTVLLRRGFIALSIGAAGLLVVAPAWGVPWLAIGFWAVAGVGMGLGFSSISFLVLRLSGPGDVGFHTSAAQIADQLGTATLIGVGGALIAVLATPAVALTVLVGLLTGLAVLGVVLAGRTATA